MSPLPLLAYAALFLASPALAQAPKLDVAAGDYVIDKTHVSVTWRIKHLGLSYYTARFTGFDSTVKLDPADLTRSSVIFTIDANSVRTDYPFPEKEDFDKVVASRFLKAEAHPKIIFQSTSLTATSATTGKLTGNMSFAGVTKPVTFDVTLNGATVHPFYKVPYVGFSARGMIKRTDFGVGEMVGLLGDEVEIWIEAEYKKAS